MKKMDNKTGSNGFTFVELLVTLAIGVGVIAAAVIGFSTIANAPQRVGSVNVDIGSANHKTLYGNEASYVTMGPNPNYYEASKARIMKDRLMDDVAAGSAVFVLGRNKLGGLRAPSYSVPSGYDFRTVTTPSAFRDYLATASGVSTTYPSNQMGALGMSNLSIFIVRGLSGDQIDVNTNKLYMVATYEVDFLSAASPSGTFASVRRYSTNENKPTDYYHVFYPDDPNTTNAFRPLAVAFERTNMPATGVAAQDVFRTADYMPFSFVWWPDPLVSYLSASNRPLLTNAAGTARFYYANMGRRTSLFFVLPRFPGQYEPVH